MPVWWLEGESESRVSWVLFTSWLLPLPCPASQLRQVTVCLLGNRSLAMKSACSFHSGTSRRRAKGSSCPRTAVGGITGQAGGYLLIIRLIAKFGLQSFTETQKGMTLIAFGSLHFLLLGSVSLSSQCPRCFRKLWRDVVRLDCFGE